MLRKQDEVDGKNRGKLFRIQLLKKSTNEKETFPDAKRDFFFF